MTIGKKECLSSSAGPLWRRRALWRDSSPISNLHHHGRQVQQVRPNRRSEEYTMTAEFDALPSYVSAKDQSTRRHSNLD